MQKFGKNHILYTHIVTTKYYIIVWLIMAWYCIPKTSAWAWYVRKYYSRRGGNYSRRGGNFNAFTSKDILLTKKLCHSALTSALWSCFPLLIVFSINLIFSGLASWSARDCCWRGKRNSTVNENRKKVSKRKENTTLHNQKLRCVPTK